MSTTSTTRGARTRTVEGSPAPAPVGCAVHRPVCSPRSRRSPCRSPSSCSRGRRVPGVLDRRLRGTGWGQSVTVAAGFWLLGHGVPLVASGTTVTLVPLGLTALALFCCFASARRSAHTATSAWVAGTVTYALATLGVALLAGSTPPWGLGVAVVGERSSEAPGSAAGSSRARTRRSSPTSPGASTGSCPGGAPRPAWRAARHEPARRRLCRRRGCVARRGSRDVGRHRRRARARHRRGSSSRSASSPSCRTSWRGPGRGSSAPASPWARGARSRPAGRSRARCPRSRSSGRCPVTTGRTPSPLGPGGRRRARRRRGRLRLAAPARGDGHPPRRRRPWSAVVLALTGVALASGLLVGFVSWLAGERWAPAGSRSWARTRSSSGRSPRPRSAAAPRSPSCGHGSRSWAGATPTDRRAAWSPGWTGQELPRGVVRGGQPAGVAGPVTRSPSASCVANG